jgi:hypothetical protein
MSDSIEIMAAGDHGNCTPIYRGVTPTFAGFEGGRVLPDNQRKGNAIDVSEYSTLRLELAVTAMTNRDGYEQGITLPAELHVSLEQSNDGANWRPLHEFGPARSVSRERAVVAGFDKYVRASWWFARPSNVASTVNDRVAFSWSLTGEALPEAGA